MQVVLWVREAEHLRQVAAGCSALAGFTIGRHDRWPSQQKILSSLIAIVGLYLPLSILVDLHVANTSNNQNYMEKHP